MLRLGIDLGGSKIETAVLDAQHQLVYRHRVATPQGDYQATLAQIVAQVALAEAQLGQPCSVGIGTPGSPSALDGHMKNCNSTCLNQQPLQADIETLLGREVRIANDANCFALSEAVDGAAAEASLVFGVILGTGVGGGLVVNKRLLQGANNIAGEWGHNPITHRHGLPDRQCYCGRTNCVETFLSGPGLAATYCYFSGERESAKTIEALASQGDKKALQSLDIYQQQLAAALAQVINVFDPDVIVLGGGMSNASSLYQTIPELWQSHVFSDHIATQLLSPKFGDASGVRGAAWLW